MKVEECFSQLFLLFRLLESQSRLAGHLSANLSGVCLVVNLVLASLVPLAATFGAHHFLLHLDCMRNLLQVVQLHVE